MNRNDRRAMLAGAGAWLLGACGPGQAQETSPLQHTIQWPPLQLAGGGMLSEKDSHNVATIVVFWATWCPYCQRHNARLNALYPTLQGSGIRLLGISTEDTAEQVLAYKLRHGLGFPLAVTGPAFRQQFSTRRRVPLTCLVRRDGTVAQTIPGELSEEDAMSLPKAMA